tara:strand:+ start:357 stop:836 length:480 start_codon:yes stop_codon:yes gene_type:complete
MIRIIVFIFIFLSFNSCGFQPMYKSDGKGIKLDRLSINFKGDITYEIKEELKSLLSTEQQNKDYIVMVEVKEEMVPVIINENGTVSKYQIDIALLFEVTNKLGEVLIDDVAVGFSQYDVLVSEIENKDLRKQMLRSATNDAASLMITKIQSKLSLIDDY